MRPLGTYRKRPALPSALVPLEALARNLRWAYRPALRDLFEELDPAAFAEAGGNPIEALRLVDPSRTRERAEDAAYVARVAEALARGEEEDASGPLHPAAAALRGAGITIAYFCAEFGITEVLPIYSGGLGILAGDHLKSASDLGVPLVAVGLFYREGFFRQSLTADARQRESYPIVDPDDLPIDVLPVASGRPVVSVKILDREVNLLVRRARVGRVTLLLLDSHLPENRASDREITSRLYGGDVERRIQQEICLGVGGMRALVLAGTRPLVCHANEGHAAFLGLERIRMIRSEHGLTFDEAREAAAAASVFTTHTPVPAGIDVFAPELMRRYFERKVDGLGIALDDLLGLGRQVPEDRTEPFSMAVLGLRLSAHVNGVSKLHAQVSRRLWRGVLPEEPLSEIPIGSVTNGVHPSTWTAPAIADLRIREAPDGVDRVFLWRRHEALRAALVDEVRARAAESRRRRGAPDADVEAAGRLLDPNALTIGFARRFATYKRATLVFHDPGRLLDLLSDPARPVQIVYAGKAHPKDEAGKEFLRRVGEFAQSPDFRGKVVLLEDYDMRLARLLVSGCDVWLNNPRRPLEASGTSGMKAAMNGVLNLSVLDGWWDEAPRDRAGFTVGDATEGRGDEEVASALYERLESEVVPLFFTRDGEDGVPRAWVDRMIRAASVLANQFSSDRMVAEYAADHYAPAAARVGALLADGGRRARELAAWKRRVKEAWTEVGFASVRLSADDPARLTPGETFVVEAEVRLGPLGADELSADWFEGVRDADGVIDEGWSTPLLLVESSEGRALFRGTITRPADDARGYTVRLRPAHADLAHANETGLVLWAG